MIYCSQLRATPSADCNISHIALDLSNYLIHTTRVNSTLRAAEAKQNGFCRYIVTAKVPLWAASYSACVVYTKTIIHLSVGESDGYLPPLW